MGLWYLLAIERMGERSRVLGALGRRPLVSFSGVLYCLGLPISLGLEEAVGTGLDILEASVRISCLDSGKKFRPLKEEEAGDKLKHAV